MINGKDIVSQARTWLGTCYHHQGRLKKSKTCKGGVDCIGLIIGVAKELGLTGANGKLLAEFDETGYSPYPDGVSLQRFLDLHFNKISANQQPIKHADIIKQGDILLFKLFTHPQHVGIAINFQGGDIRSIGVIHCYSASGQVVEHHLSIAWQKMLVGVYRFRGLE
jgi:cell wall-associated NlpC family hydrolase